MSLKLVEKSNEVAFKAEETLKCYVPTVGEAFEKYIEVRKLKKVTAKNYRCKLNRCYPDWADLRIDEIDGLMIEERHNELSVDTPTQANQAMKVLSFVIGWACKYWLTPQGKPLPIWNPVERLTVIGAWNFEATRVQKFIPDDQLKPWWLDLHEMVNPHIRDLCVFALFTGCRIGEAMSLKWEHVDLDSKQFCFIKTKSKRILKLPMPDYLHKRLEARRIMFPNSVYVFQGGDPLSPISKPYYATAVVRKHSELKWSPHDLRRTFVNICSHPSVTSYRDENGILKNINTELAIKTVLNHSTDDVTHRHYLSPHQELLRILMNNVAVYILEKVGENNPSLDQRVVSDVKPKRVVDKSKAELWNEVYGVGTEVIFHDDTKDIRTTTRSTAWMLDGEAFIVLDEVSGARALEFIDPVSEVDPGSLHKLPV